MQKVLLQNVANIGIRLNQNPPNVVIEKEGISLYCSCTTKKTYKNQRKISKDILNLYGMTSARVVIREDVTSEQIVDHISGNKTYAKAITILNKIDLVDDTFLKGLKSQISFCKCLCKL